MKVKEIIKFFTDEENIAVQDTIIRLHYFTEDEYTEECTYRENQRIYEYSHKCVCFNVYDDVSDEILETETIYNFIHTEAYEDHQTIYVDCQVITE